jgi:hypothetical protein
MGQTAASHTGEQRRRSTRLTQTVPLTVRGVDLLGQPFEERSSTLVLNFHGCRYTSKHHLPKNTWVALEIPDAQAERGRRTVRARVAWIQRPRTVRELFQIGVELETPGNVWGVADAPADWAAAPEPERPSSQTVESGKTNGREFELPGFAPAVSSTLPAPLANYIERLLTEVRHQGQAAGSTAPAATATEVSPLMRELSAQIERQTEKAVEAASTRVDQMIRRATEKLERDRKANAEAIEGQQREEFERLRKEIAEQLAENQDTYLARLSEEFQKDVERSHEVVAELEHKAELARGEISGIAESALKRLEHLRNELDATEAALMRREEQVNRSAASVAAADEGTRAAWRERLDSEMAVAREQWNELLQSSLDNAVQRLVTRLTESSQNVLASSEQKLSARLTEISQPIAQTAAEARETLATVRAALEQEVARAKDSLNEIEQAGNRMSEYSAQLEAASQDTVNELHRRLETILSSQAAELNRRAETLIAGLAERVTPTLESAGQQYVSRVVAEVEAKLGPHLERAQNSLHRMAAREEQVEETLRVHRERLRQASEQHQRETTTQMTGLVSQLKNEFEEARRESLVKWNEELDASGVRATHSALEEMIKASDWYKAKANSEMQTLVEEAVQKAGKKLEETAGEVLQRFGGDLERQRSSHLEEAKVLLEAASGDAITQARNGLAQAAETAARSFGETLSGISAQASERFVETTRSALEEQTACLQAAAEKVRQSLEREANESATQFQVRVTQQADKTLEESQQSLAAQLATTLEGFGRQREAQQQEWLANLARLSSESEAQYEERLKTASDSWLMSSVRKLNEHGQNVIDSLSKAAEQALRSTCSNVFDSLAETMRERLLGTPGRAAAGVPIPPDEPPPQDEKRLRS